MRYEKNKEFQRGMTLIEVAIVIVITAILIGVVYQVFMTGNIVFDKAQVEFDLMQNARIAMDWIIRDVRNGDHISIDTNTLTVFASDNSTIKYYASDTSNDSRVLMRSVSGVPNPITNEEAYLETCVFTPLSPPSGALEVKLGFQAFNIKAKKKQKSLSGNVPSFSIMGKIFVKKVILNTKWGE